ECAAEHPPTTKAVQALPLADFRLADVAEMEEMMLLCAFPPNYTVVTHALQRPLPYALWSRLDVLCAAARRPHDPECGRLSPLPTVPERGGYACSVLQ